MIDLHCHFLPGIDDGPETMDESLALARMAVDNGIEMAVLTPHIHHGRYDNNFYSIYGKFEEFKKKLEQYQIPLKINMAAEVRLSEEILPMFGRAHIPFLGKHEGYKIMLLEFPHSHIPVGGDKLVKHLLSLGIKPLIAHPERNKAVMKNIEKIIPFLDMGCMLQLTSRSLTGGFGEKCKVSAEEMLLNGWVSVLATDAHNTTHRPPHLAEGRDAVEVLLGEEAALDLVKGAPSRILGGW